MKKIFIVASNNDDDVYIYTIIYVRLVYRPSIQVQYLIFKIRYSESTFF